MLIPTIGLGILYLSNVNPHLGELIGDKAVLPNKILHNKFSIDGIDYKVIEVRNTEANLLALIEIEKKFCFYKRK